MRHRSIAAVLAILAFASTSSLAGPSPLTDADRKAFAWFDGIGLPSCAGKPYVRVRWVQDGAEPDAPGRDEVWEVDGFVVAERDGLMTLLDGDLWPRKVERKPSPGWTGAVLPLDLARVARAATSRLRAVLEDPGAVEAMDELYRGVRIRFGDEGQTLALARHCAEKGLEREAHALLEAARALPHAGASAGAPLEDVAAGQMAESVIWRIVYDFGDESISRARLLERFRGWRKSFPASPHVARADDAMRVLAPMVAEDAARPAVPDAELESLPPERRALELVQRLRDQTGDVFMGRDGRVSISTGGAGTPAGRLIAMGPAAAPALVDAVTDERFTRAVLFVEEMSFKRQVVARVGDLARVALESIAKQAFWEAPEDEPSMFQNAAAAEVQERCREWLASEGSPGGDSR